MYHTELCGDVTCAVFSLDYSGDPLTGEIVIPMIELSKVASQIGVKGFTSQYDLMQKFNFALIDFVISASEEMFQVVLAPYCRFCGN